MFKRTKAVIAVSKEKIVASIVVTRPPVRVKEEKEYKWTPERLKQVFTEVKDFLKVSSARILLDEDLAYVVRFKIPADLPQDKERSFISEKIAEQVPEVLEGGDWDYKVLGEDNENEVIAFAPVKDIFENINSAAKEAGLRVEAVEPEKIAAERHSNPVVGLALKKDIKGKDRDVLNLIKQEEKKEEQGREQELKGDIISGLKGPRTKRLPALLVMLMIASLAFGLVYYAKIVKRQGLPEQPTPTPTPVLSPSPTPAPAPEVNLSDYSVQILNGSGEAGEAGRVRGLLEDEGFEKFSLGNADSFDYKDTEVSIKGEVSGGVFEMIQNALKDYEVAKGQPLTEESVYDVVVIVGRAKR